MKAHLTEKLSRQEAEARLTAAVDALNDVIDNAPFDVVFELDETPPMPTLPENERCGGAELTVLDYYALGVLTGLILAGIAVGVMLP